MADISKWSPVAANNNDPPPDGAPEGMPASAVNDTMRENMAANRRHAEDGGWFDWGDSYSYVSADTFQVAGDRSATYTVGRRVRIVQTATVYGVISGVAVGANTDVTIAADDGASLANEAMVVSVGFEPGVLPIDSYTGEVRMFGYALSDPAWLLCDGSAVSRTTYAALFAALGTTHGSGDDLTTFNLPDLRGRSPMGDGQGDTADGGGSGTNRTLADKVGAETRTLANNQLPTRIGTASEVLVSTATTDVSVLRDQGGGDGMPNEGGGQAHDNTAPAYVLRFYIRA